MPPHESFDVTMVDNAAGTHEHQSTADARKCAPKVLCMSSAAILLVLAILGCVLLPFLPGPPVFPPAFLPLRSPGGAPQAQEEGAGGTLLTVTMFLSRDFSLRERYARRVVGSLTDTFSDAMRREFRRPSEGFADETQGQSKILVVNECVPQTETPDLKAKVAAMLEEMRQNHSEWNFELIQKTSNCGQANSLNIILDRLHPYRYWLQWEESWYVNPDFTAKYDMTAYWDALYQVLSDKPEVGSLSLTGTGESSCAEWTTCVSKLPITDRFKEKLPRLHGNMGRFWYHVNTGEYWRDDWLPFSLRPAINRVSQALSAGYFDPDPLKRAVLFEQEWAMKWSYGTGGAWPPALGYSKEKAFVGSFGPSDYPVAIRDTDHKHTYRRLAPLAAVPLARAGDGLFA